MAEGGKGPGWEPQRGGGFSSCEDVLERHRKLALQKVHSFLAPQGQGVCSASMACVARTEDGWMCASPTHSRLTAEEARLRHTCPEAAGQLHGTFWFLPDLILCLKDNVSGLRRAGVNFPSLSQGYAAGGEGTMSPLT